MKTIKSLQENSVDIVFDPNSHNKFTLDPFEQNENHYKIYKATKQELLEYSFYKNQEIKTFTHQSPSNYEQELENQKCIWS